RLPKRVLVTDKERRQLLKFGKLVGKAIKELISIVTPRTFLSWLNQEKKDARGNRKKTKPGRPKTPEEIRKLVIKIAKENGWGLGRLLGELKKLGVKVCKTTVKNILKADGIDPQPERSQKPWADFIREHAETLWATDFFSKKVWTLKGYVDVFVLFFIHVESRRVYLAGMTTHPDNTWMKQQARNLSMFWDKEKVKPTYLIRDFDGKYTNDFDAILEVEDVEIKRVGPRMPNMNAYAERFVQSIKQECLDHFICVGEEHLRYLCTEYVAFYNSVRPHQGKDNMPLKKSRCRKWKETDLAKEVVCAPRLGGLLKSYHRRAA
ncbi:MAG TPA: integrase core domain-containing protein, partial [Gemmatales bacterium]|nr:integrase core domain-containing protein [Gemmatales bacterium]